jgi:hypothetical protein
MRYGGSVKRNATRRPGRRRPRVTAKEEKVMLHQAPGPSEMYARFAGKTVEAIGLWAEANQRVLTELADFTSGTAREGARLYAELQQNALQALRQAPTSPPWQPTTWPESYQAAVRLLEGNLQAATRSAERVHSSAEQAGKGIQEALAAVAEKLQGFSAGQS